MKHLIDLIVKIIFVLLGFSPLYIGVILGALINEWFNLFCLLMFVSAPLCLMVISKSEEWCEK